MFGYKVFVSDVNFSYAEFNGGVDFPDAKFNLVNFSYAKFNGGVYFFGAKFNLVNFSYAKFNGRVNFSSAEFNDMVYFIGAKFNGGVNFISAEFNLVNFFRAKFNDMVYFFAKFKDLVYFSNVYFDDEVDFYRIIFPTSNNQEDIPVRFDYATFKKRVRFLGDSSNPLNLEAVSFKGVDLSNFEFHNVRWKEKEERLFYILPLVRRKIIIDEEFMDKNKNYEDVSKIYNQLRKNYESRLLFNEASNFFIGEMEAIRRSLLNNSRLRDKLGSIPYWIYKWLSMYGESVFLPLIVWTPLIIVVFAFLRIMQGVGALDALTDSIAAYFQISRSNQALDIYERILAIPVLGSAFIALRRKFERKK